MPAYRYKAINRIGGTVTGDLSAVDAVAVVQMLTQWNLQPLRIRQRKQVGSIQRLWAFNRDEVMTALLADLADLLDSGLPLDKALRQLCLSSNWRVVEIAEELSQKINRGSSFSQALWQGGWLDDSACRLIEVAETSAVLSEGLLSVVTIRRASRYFRKRLWRACAYPLLMIIVLLFLVVFLLLSVLPSLVDFLSGLGQPLPYSVSLVSKVTEKMSATAVAAFIGLLFVPALLLWLPSLLSVPELLRHSRDRVLLNLPLVGRLAVLSFRVQFSRELSTFTKAGLDLVPALASIADSTGNSYIKRNTELIVDELQDGLSLATAMQCSGLFSKSCIHVVAMGESTGDYTEPFEKLQSINNVAISRWFDRMERRVGPVLLGIAGLLILWIVMVVISPMYRVALGVGTAL